MRAPERATLAANQENILIKNPTRGPRGRRDARTEGDLPVPARAGRVARLYPRSRDVAANRGRSPPLPVSVRASDGVRFHPLEWRLEDGLVESAPVSGAGLYLRAHVAIAK